MCISTNHQSLGSCFVVLVASFNGNLSLTVGYPSPTYERSCIFSSFLSLALFLFIYIFICLFDLRVMNKILATAINIARARVQQ